MPSATACPAKAIECLTPLHGDSPDSGVPYLVEATMKRSPYYRPCLGWPAFLTTIRWIRTTLIVVGFGVGGCKDYGTLTESPTGERADGAERFSRSSGGVRSGYIVGRDGSPLKVTFDLQGELAILEGDI